MTIRSCRHWGTAFCMILFSASLAAALNDATTKSQYNVERSASSPTLAAVVGQVEYGELQSGSS